MREKTKTWAKAVTLAVAIISLVGCGGITTVYPSETTSQGGGSSRGGGTGISSSFDSPCEMSVGDLMPIEFTESSTVEVDFSCVASDAKFILAVGSSSESGSGASMQLSAGNAIPNPSYLSMAAESDAVTFDEVANEMGDEYREDVYGPSEIMSAWLRASESELYLSEQQAEPLPIPSNSKAMSVKAGGVGSTETFRVLSSLSSTSSYVEVTGEVACVGDDVIFYVDTSVSTSLLSDDDVDTLCDNFDVEAGEEQDVLGSSSDVDGDGMVHVLMTKQVNRLGALGGGIITGYFYAGDLYSRSSSNPVSNGREIIYTMVPDPSGQYGTAISHDFAMSNLLPAVLPHEFQHAISYNQHVFESGGYAEENWLNEGMSHFMEDYMGYNVENPSRYAMYLASPSTYGLVTSGSPNLMERGAAYLFVRFLYEQASDKDTFLGALEKTGLGGVDNLESAFDGPSDFDQFSEFMARWVAALAMTDRGISQDSRYTYSSRTANSRTGNWEGVCLYCEADDNRGTMLTGVYLNPYYGNHTARVDSATATFFDVSTVPSSMRLTGTAGGGDFGLLIRYE